MPRRAVAVPVAVDPLADLAGRIVAAHERCEAAFTEGMRHAVEAGSLLIEAKAQVGHGN